MLSNWTATSYTGIASNFADFPMVGIDANALYISTNNFTCGGEFHESHAHEHSQERFAVEHAQRREQEQHSIARVRVDSPQPVVDFSATKGAGVFVGVPQYDQQFNEFGLHQSDRHRRRRGEHSDTGQRDGSFVQYSDELGSAAGWHVRIGQRRRPDSFPRLSGGQRHLAGAGRGGNRRGECPQRGGVVSHSITTAAERRRWSLRDCCRIPRGISITSIRRLRPM